ncbi:MAG: alpha-amylase family glycosyl hydrolase [Lachnospiraceae bacterium]|nr:alpha-amylase family glycosyl hydrolase [Lachnospiraceae bacterium]
MQVNLTPLDNICGYDVRPGFYDINGATAIPCGVNFTIQSSGATSCELLLFKRGETEPTAEIKIPEHYKIGHVYSIVVFGLDISELEYAYRLDGPCDPSKGLLFSPQNKLLDPYAKAVANQSKWRSPVTGQYKARVVRDDYDWEDLKMPRTPMSDLIIYELHVRGFTQHLSSEVKNPGTFDGIIEKIPYLKELGINAVELMPVFEFDEMLSFRNHNGNELIDYWGYNSVSFFAPNTSYASTMECNGVGNELKRLVHALKENGIEVILDVVFNHTAEGDENGRIFSFKGLDNNIYYLLTPNGRYYNYSGCGNTLNCNHPIVRQMILECLRYWVVNYRIDGFRFDLASILGRNEDGSPMNQPPLLHLLAFDPILSGVKLIAEAWDAGGLYQVGSFPAWNRWAEWNGKYRDDMRSFLKGDGGLGYAAAQRIAGSVDLYNPIKRGNHVSVNFITCHDGFTLYDLYAYNRKHNESNGWNNTDGTDDNRSWNCGAEGDTDDHTVLALRNKLIKNACAVLFCSRGTPMFLAGDEFLNTQFGNNNPYCQDNEISWLDWSMLEKNRDIFDFFKFMIAFRKAHPAIRYVTEPCSLGFPDVSFHGERAWNNNFGHEGRNIGVMFAGEKENGEDDIVYIAVNTYWESVNMELPRLPESLRWIQVADTCAEDSTSRKAVNLSQDGRVKVEARAVVVLTAEMNV